jgi:hypothetical protein
MDRPLASFPFFCIMNNLSNRILLVSGAMLLMGTNALAQMRDRETPTPSATGLVAAASREPMFTLAAPDFIIADTDPGRADATVALGSPQSTGNMAVVELINDAPERFPYGTTIVTWTARDAEGRTAHTMQTVLVRDTEAPTIAVPRPVVATAEVGASEVPAARLILGSPTVNDNCPQLVLTSNAPASFPMGTTTVTWTATDAAGNTAVASQTVTVRPDTSKTASARATERQ